MNIAQIAPLWKNVSSRGTSDPERAHAYLTDELVRRGHQVTLFASADSHTNAKLEPLSATPFFRSPANWGQAGATIMAVEQAFGPRADEFDIIHSHFGIDGFPLAWRCPIPTLTTIHERLDLPVYVPVFKQFRGLPLVSTSQAQREPLPWASWQRTIYPGVPSDLYRFSSRPGKYLACMCSPSEEGLSVAIELARRAHLPLRVASREAGIEGLPLSIPMELLIAGNDVEWLGDLTEADTGDFLGEALALVCTQGGPAPSELSVAAALACGTPVLALEGGTAGEMIYDHITGFDCDSVDEMVEVLPCIGDIDRRECRGVFEKRFSTERMADQYLALYQRLIDAVESRQVRIRADRPSLAVSG